MRKRSGGAADSTLNRVRRNRRRSEGVEEGAREGAAVARPCGGDNPKRGEASVVFGVVCSGLPRPKRDGRVGRASMATEGVENRRPHEKIRVRQRLRERGSTVALPRRCR